MIWYHDGVCKSSIYIYISNMWDNHIIFIYTVNKNRTQLDIDPLVHDLHWWGKNNWVWINMCFFLAPKLPYIYREMNDCTVVYFGYSIFKHTHINQTVSCFITVWLTLIVDLLVLSKSVSIFVGCILAKQHLSSRAVVIRSTFSSLYPLVN